MPSDLLKSKATGKGGGLLSNKQPSRKDGEENIMKQKPKQGKISGDSENIILAGTDTALESNLSADFSYRIEGTKDQQLMPEIDNVDATASDNFLISKPTRQEDKQEENNDQTESESDLKAKPSASPDVTGHIQNTPVNAEVVQSFQNMDVGCRSSDVDKMASVGYPVGIPGSHVPLQPDMYNQHCVNSQAMSHPDVTSNQQHVVSIGHDCHWPQPGMQAVSQTAQASNVGLPGAQLQQNPMHSSNVPVGLLQQNPMHPSNGPVGQLQQNPMHPSNGPVGHLQQNPMHPSSGPVGQLQQNQMHPNFGSIQPLLPLASNPIRTESIHAQPIHKTMQVHGGPMTGVPPQQINNPMKPESTQMQFTDTPMQPARMGHIAYQMQSAEAPFQTPGTQQHHMGNSSFPTTGSPMQTEHLQRTDDVEFTI